MITKFKIFENYIRLNDLPFYKDDVIAKHKESDFKYKIGDIVRVKELDRHYIIKNLNDSSSTQDYYIYNPLHENDRGWVSEEELTDPDVNSENYEQVKYYQDLKNNTNKYNL
jgi:hypothetical protein